MSNKKKKEEVEEKYSYEDPNSPGSLGGVANYARNKHITLNKAKKELESNLAYTLHKPVRRRGKFRPVLVFDKDEQWVADLIEVQKLSKQNRGFKFLLTVIDAFSKFAWIEPLKRKTGPEVTKAFEAILKRAKKQDHQAPQRLQTDKGKEFYNTQFQNLLKKYNIHHFSTQGDAKASVIERWNRTFKTKLYRYFTAGNTLKYLDVIQPLVNQYNKSFHRSIGVAPEKVNEANSRKVWYKMYDAHIPKKGKPLKPKFKVGDRVRLSEQVRTFKKGYLPNWTEEIFIVSQLIPSFDMVLYKVTELDGSPIEGAFYDRDLQKVSVDMIKDVFRVEKVLKRRKNGKELFVKWKGYPSKYNSWINKSDVI